MIDLLTMLHGIRTTGSGHAGCDFDRVVSALGVNEIATRLGGDAYRGVGPYVRTPLPGRGPADRSLVVVIDYFAPAGWYCRAVPGVSVEALTDYVAKRLADGPAQGDLFAGADGHAHRRTPVEVGR